MIDDGRDDQMLRNLGLLRPLSPDPQRGARVRARCRERLARNSAVRRPACAGVVPRILAPVLVGGLCALYIAELVGAAIRLQGMFR